VNNRNSKWVEYKLPGIILILILLFSGCTAVAEQSDPSEYPPVILGQSYPDMKLIDLQGRHVKLSQFKGKVILVELIGMPCQACQAFSGGHRTGGFRGVKPQPNIPDIERLLVDYARIRADHPDLQIVQILLYSMEMAHPTLEDGRAWAMHFGLQNKSNFSVLVPTSSLISNRTYRMIPGFHLIDQNFIFKSDSSGHRPKHNLYTELLPMLGKLVG